MEDNKKSQNQPYSDEPVKMTLSEQPYSGDDASTNPEMDPLDSQGEDFIDLTEIVDAVEDDEIPIELDDIVPADDPVPASTMDQAAMDNDLIELVDIIPAAQPQMDDAPATTEADGDQDDELIELTDSILVDELTDDEVASGTSPIVSEGGRDTDDMVDLTDVVEMAEPQLETSTLDAIADDEDDIIDLTDTVWPEEPEETEAADTDNLAEPAEAETAPEPDEPSTGEFGDDFGDAFIDITDIDLTDLQDEEQTTIPSASDEQGEEEVLELADDVGLDVVADLPSADPSGVVETADDVLSAPDMIEGIDVPEDSDNRTEEEEEEVIEPVGMIAPVESESEGSLDNLTAEDLTNVSEDQDQSAMEVQDQAEALPEEDGQDSELSHVELTEQVTDQMPVILLEDEIVSPQNSLLEKIDAVLNEKGPSPETLMERPAETSPPDYLEPAVTVDEIQEAPPSEAGPEWDTAESIDIEPSATDEPPGDVQQDISEDTDRETDSNSVLDIEMLESMMSDTFSGESDLINLDDVLGRHEDDTADESEDADEAVIEDYAEPAAGRTSDDFTIGIALDDIDMEDEGVSVSQEEIESAVERVIQKKYGQSIEQLIATTVEKMVSREIESIRRSMLEDEDSTD